jgi:hypothetical protein
LSAGCEPASYSPNPTNPTDPTNQQPASMKTVFILPVILLGVFLPLSVYGGTIRTSITATHTVTDQGGIEFDLMIRNKGDVTAHHVVATLTLADLIKTYDRLGDNPAGGEIRVTETLLDPCLDPGKYVAVIRVDFEEQSGTPHHAYHFFDIPYRVERMPSSNLPLFLETAASSFNKKAFWDKDGTLRLSVKNDGGKEIRLNASLFLPEGFSSPEPTRTFRLNPGETKVEEIPVSLKPEGKNQSLYHLIVWCDHLQAHYSWDLKGTITVEGQPVYFKGYLILGGVIGVILFLALFMRNRPGMVRNR